jgi:hypothetical protein
MIPLEKKVENIILKDSFRTGSGQHQDSFRTASGQLQDSFRTASGQLQDSFRTALGIVLLRSFFATLH